jgi:malonyl-CoA/methylmalonyl-CoA synthetase
MTNFYQSLETAFGSRLDAPALILKDRPDWNFQQLVSVVDRFAAVLCAQGVAAGDRVMAQVEKSPENLALYLATLKVGGVYVPLNTAYTVAELDYFVDDAQPRLFVGTDIRVGVSSFTLDGNGQGTLLEAAAEVSASDGIETVDRQTQDLAAILYTSGTTGRSKGAMLTHSNLASNARSLSEYWGWQDDDVLLNALPIFHVHGLFIASHCALLNATPMIFHSKFVAEDVLAALPDCTVLMGVPTFYTRLLQQPELSREQTRNVRVFVCGSAPLTEQTFAAWEQATGHKILERYGMSETIINTSNPLVGDRVPGTVGFPLPNQEVRVADAEGVEVPRGDVGTIEVRGPNVFSGYWQQPDKTAQEIRPDGFFITGDLGTQEPDGRVAIVGRAKDLVISGGYNVYPKEVERLLDEMPDIVESAVIGVPHDDFGEAVVAVLVAAKQLDVDALNSALADQLARFKQPKAVIYVDELPRNTMGKVQKNVLRDQHKDLFVDA